MKIRSPNANFIIFPVYRYIPDKYSNLRLRIDDNCALGLRLFSCSLVYGYWNCIEGTRMSNHKSLRSEFEQDHPPFLNAVVYRKCHTFCCVLNHSVCHMKLKTLIVVIRICFCCLQEFCFLSSVWQSKTQSWDCRILPYNVSRNRWMVLKLGKYSLYITHIYVDHYSDMANWAWSWLS